MSKQINSLPFFCLKRYSIAVMDALPIEQAAGYQPRILRILWRDGIAASLASIVVVAALISPLIYFLTGDLEFGLVLLCPPALVAVVLTVHVCQLIYLQRHGVLVAGKIVSRFSGRTGVLLQYEFDYQDQRIKALTSGSVSCTDNVVTIVVDPDSPKRSDVLNKYY